PTPPAADLPGTPEELGQQLLGLVVAAQQRGWDAEDALRSAVRGYAADLDVAAAARAATGV
ncbi:MAG: Nucleoside triphosphate pyrophosphohydrolase MazG, partial [Klenkia sp.]|nr:Nucleoside triphosphate pyrophosphohydrolase MazG [Klenkia sp.]